MFCSPGDIWQCLEIFLIVTTQGRCYWHMGMMLTILQCTGWPPQQRIHRHGTTPRTKTHQAPNVSGTEVGKPCSKSIRLIPQQVCEAGVVKSHFLSGTLRPREGKRLPVASQPGHRRPPRVQGVWKWRAFQARSPPPAATRPIACGPHPNSGLC